MCIRFPPGTRLPIRAAARSLGLSISDWVRQVTSERVKRVSGGTKVPAPRFIPPGGKDREQVCVRFLPDELQRIQQAARQEGFLPSPWIRAVVLARLWTVS